MNAKKLRLKAENPDDIGVLGGVLQDALIPVSDMAYLSAENQFVMVANRFCWEAEPDGDTAYEGAAAGERRPHFRVNCGVTFHGVTNAQTRGFDRADHANILSLLTIQAEAGVDASEITLICAGDASIRLTAESIDCRLDDMGEPWPTVWRPSHEDEEAT